MSRTTRRCTAWIALVAMWLGLLLPTLAHALAEPGNTAWTEVCTAQGMKRIPVDATAVGQADAPVSLNGVLDHCPWCTLTASSAMAPPPAPPVLMLPAIGGTTHPERFFTAPRTPHAWRPSQPRGPPLLLG